MKSIFCIHNDAQDSGQVCMHLLDAVPERTDYHRWFSGHGSEYRLVCAACHRRLVEGVAAVDVAHICQPCFQTLETEGCFDGVAGRPAVLVCESNLSVVVETIELPLPGRILALQPLNSHAESRWIALTTGGDIVRLDLGLRSVKQLARLVQTKMDLDKDIELCVSSDGRWAALANTHGRYGCVVDLQTGQMTLQLERDDYHFEQSCFPLAFFESSGRTLFVHGTKWNRLDISDPGTGEVLTQRFIADYEAGTAQPAHYLDYFHAGLTVSPDQEWIVDNGWVWQPAGVICAWKLQEWVHKNVWESEDGASLQSLCDRYYYWDGPVCWLDEHILAVWGYGNDEEWLLPAVRIFDVATQQELRWFAGPKGSLAFDTYLLAFSHKDPLTVWDCETGERLLVAPDFYPTHYHAGARQFLALKDAATIEVGMLRA